MTTTWTVIVCGGFLLFAVVGLIVLGAPKREPWPPPPPPLAMFPAELQALLVRDSIARRELKPPADPIADMFAVRDGIANGEDEHCPASDDAQHCEAWWDGDQCHWCQAPAMTAEERTALGMEPAADVHALAALPADELAKLRDSLGADDDGKPVPAMRARADLDTMRADGSWRL